VRLRRTCDPLAELAVCFGAPETDFFERLDGLVDGVSVQLQGREASDDGCLDVWLEHVEGAQSQPDAREGHFGDDCICGADDSSVRLEADEAREELLFPEGLLLFADAELVAVLVGPVVWGVLDGLGLVEQLADRRDVRELLLAPPLHLDRTAADKVDVVDLRTPVDEDRPEPEGRLFHRLSHRFQRFVVQHREEVDRLQQTRLAVQLLPLYVAEDFLTQRQTTSYASRSSKTK